jgi:hypothetical protein
MHTCIFNDNFMLNLYKNICFMVYSATSCVFSDNFMLNLCKNICFMIYSATCLDFIMHEFVIQSIGIGLNH